MKSNITLSNMEFYGYIGCFDEEKIIGTRFSVSVSLRYDMQRAALDDDLSQALDYQAVYGVIKKAMQEKVNLLETMAHRISQQIKSTFPMVEQLTVSIAKLNPMLAVGGKIDAVTVTLTL